MTKNTKTKVFILICRLNTYIEKVTACSTLKDAKAVMKKEYDSLMKETKYVGQIKKTNAWVFDGSLKAEDEEGESYDWSIYETPLN